VGVGTPELADVRGLLSARDQKLGVALERIRIRALDRIERNLTEASVYKAIPRGLWLRRPSKS
jgi:hypothetical protein